jgi:hypothetical protein
MEDGFTADGLFAVSIRFQRLKPVSLAVLFGAAEATPCYESFNSEPAAKLVFSCVVEKAGLFETTLR